MIAKSGEITRELGSAVGAIYLSTGKSDAMAHVLDAWPRALIAARVTGWPRAPGWVVRPGSSSEVARVLRIATRHGIAVVPFGAGSSLVGGAAPRRDRPCIVLNCQRLSGILDLDVAGRVVNVQAGTLGVEMEAELGRHEMTCGHFPLSLTMSTIGGWLATQGYGLLSSRFGRISERCLGLTAVLATGETIETRTVPRRAAGPDLQRLLIGSEGTLGVITSVRLKLERAVQVPVFDTFGFSDLRAATRTMARIPAGSIRPLAMRLIPAGRQEWGEHRWHLIVVSGGAPTLVAAERNWVRAHVNDAGGVDIGAGPAREWWDRRFSPVFRLSPKLGEPTGLADVVSLGAPWTRVADVYEGLVALLDERGLGADLSISHPGHEGAIVTGPFFGNSPSGTAPLRYLDATWQEIARVGREHGGLLAHGFGAGLHRLDLLDVATQHRLALLRVVKQQLDPAGIMNPGVLGTDP